MNTNLFNTNETTFFDIFSLMYCDFARKYGCGILSYKEEDISNNIKQLSFYGDGLLHCKMNVIIEGVIPWQHFIILDWYDESFNNNIMSLNDIKKLIFK
jgi:hypothetical protein